ncbi:MAG TPA: AcvB/VirJ family lysyl-phosphatidylglycerol hydrolase [Candidatus Competibacteraceae bacterium]|nr:AcvB/VirJ family lysyl-phosphatidylglycerol hydrolase [Candidatus Competibacteraceae bacterium]
MLIIRNNRRQNPAVMKSSILYRLSQALCLAIAVLAVSNTQAEIAEKTLDNAVFGKLAIYRTAGEPKGVVLLLSGTAGWDADMTSVAQEIAQLNYVAAGIDLNQYMVRLDQSKAACLDLPADLGQLNQWIAQRYPLASRLPPVLLGYGAGAALGYAALAQAPADRFHAGIGVNFCPELPLSKPLCPGTGKLEGAALPDHQGMRLKPITRMPATWFVFQNQPACEVATTIQFVQSIQLARLTGIPGKAGVKDWLPQVSALLQWLDPSIVKQVQPDASIMGIPLTEVPVTGGPDRPQLAVMLSGDGGWALLDRSMTAELAKNGLPVIGWDSLSYFWKARQPDEVALDLERTLRQYLDTWKKERIVLIGYSFGADALPAIANRLPPALRARIDLMVFLGLSDNASFEFHLSDWISDNPDEGDQPVRPELAKLSTIKRLCIYGAEEEDASCPKLADLGIIVQQMPGDHHFDEDYQGLARRILDQLPQPPIPQPPAKN